MVQRLRWSDRPDLESWSANLASSDLGKSEFNTLLSSDLASAELMYEPVILARAGMAESETRRHELVAQRMPASTGM